MSEAKPQDGTTVKGYRTLTPGDIERMNRLKGVSRHFVIYLIQNVSMSMTNYLLPATTQLKHT